MPADWTCHLCGTPVSWGTDVCPLCGSALTWEEEDDEQPLAHLMPPTWDDAPVARRKRRVRRYAIGAVVVGLGFTPALNMWGLLFLGALSIGVGVYALVTLPRRYF
jgi:hypothetical protein